MSHVRHSICALIAFVLQGVAFAQEGVPALRVTAPNGSASVLIGSLHIAAEDLRQPSASVMEGTKRYVVEGVPERVQSALFTLAPEVLQGHAKRATWADPLTDDQVEELRRHVRCDSAIKEDPSKVVSVFLALKSPALAADLAARRCATPGLLSRDALLERAAAQHGLRPSPLESQEQANKQRMAVPDRIYQALLYGSFSRESKESLLRTVRALNAGHYEEVTQALRALAPSPADADTFHELMVANRNKTWMPVLTGYLDEGHAFVNVGSAHLPGPDGLISLLRARGYKVEPTLLPVGPTH